MFDYTKIFIDTDIGDDIDDALALAFALKLQNVEIVGISTVFNNSVIRARLAKKLLQVAGAPAIPVYAGYGNGLMRINDTEQDIAQHYAGIDDPECCPDNNDTHNPDEAVDFMINSARKYGKELTLVCIGPLTNVAKAILKDRDAFLNIRKVVLMGGAYYEQFSEWNIQCDPEAADVVFRSGINLECVGTDVTMKCRLPDNVNNQLLNLHNQTITGFLAELTRFWHNKTGRDTVLHDPLAIWCACTHDLLSIKKVLVEVELGGKYARGMTINLDNFYRYMKKKQGYRVSVAKDVDSERFIRLFLKTVFGESFSVSENAIEKECNK